MELHLQQQGAGDATVMLQLDKFKINYFRYRKGQQTVLFEEA